jgi:hypothetical protein
MCVYMSEISSNRLRAQGVALGISALYLAGEVTLVAAPAAIYTIGQKFHLVPIYPSVVYIVVV